jgi:hypothetical protein
MKKVAILAYGSLIDDGPELTPRIVERMALDNIGAIRLFVR